MRRGQSLVVWAINEDREAAPEVHAILSGKDADAAEAVMRRSMDA